MEKARKTNLLRVDETYLECGVRISTVFLGLDYNFSHPGPPALFETMIFSAAKHKNEFNNKYYHEDLYMDRYSTKEEALTGHKRAIVEYKAGMIENPYDDKKLIAFNEEIDEKIRVAYRRLNYLPV